jgi:hypothetical protein
MHTYAQQRAEQQAKMSQAGGAFNASAAMMAMQVQTHIFLDKFLMIFLEAFFCFVAK